MYGVVPAFLLRRNKVFLQYKVAKTYSNLPYSTGRSTSRKIFFMYRLLLHDVLDIEFIIKLQVLTLSLF